LTSINVAKKINMFKKSKIYLSHLDELNDSFYFKDIDSLDTLDSNLNPINFDLENENQYFELAITGFFFFFF
jgi:hypothetical protein